MARSLVWCSFLVLVCLSACAETGEEAFYAGNEALVAICGGSARYPTSAQDFSRLYAARGFLAPGGPGNHLGRDIQYPQGTAMKPILCGRIAYYGPASGYGTLVVAIEHALNRAVSVTNGAGQRVLVTSFISIYGHLRKEPLSGAPPLAWRAGDQVSANDVIGYVQADALNGDGAEHLHLGIRLQSVQQAQQSDGRYWLRGYDSNPTKRAWFADPQTFLSELIASEAPIRWHPAGAYLVTDSGDGYVVSRDGLSLLAITPAIIDNEGYRQHALHASDEEIRCYARQGSYAPRYKMNPGDAPFVARYTDRSTVYQYYSTSDTQDWRSAFISWEAFVSHGWTADDVSFFDPATRPNMEALYAEAPPLRMHEGTLVKARGAPAIYVVSNGQRRPLFNWNTFQAMGYDLRRVYEIDGTTLDAVAGPLGPVIRLEDAMQCLANGI